MKHNKSTVAGLTLAGALVLSITAPATTLAQAPASAPASNSNLDLDVGRLMAFDANHDGKVQRSEVNNKRLLALFDAIDSARTSTVSRAQIAAYFKKQADSQPPGGPQGGPGGPGGFVPGHGPGGFRPGAGPGPGGFAPGRGFGSQGRGGFGGMRRGFGGPPRPGQLLPEMLQNQLKLTDDQKIELAKLQKDVDLKLAKLLTADQNKQLEAMKTRGPGRGLGGTGRGLGGPRPGPGGPGGPGRGPGGPPGPGGPGN